MQAQNKAPLPGHKTKKRLILSQTMVIDIDPHKVRSAACLRVISILITSLIAVKRPGGVGHPAP